MLSQYFCKAEGQIIYETSQIQKIYKKFLFDNQEKFSWLAYSIDIGNNERWWNLLLREDFSIHSASPISPVNTRHEH